MPEVMMSAMAPSWFKILYGYEFRRAASPYVFILADHASLAGSVSTQADTGQLSPVGII